VEKKENKIKLESMLRIHVPTHITQLGVNLSGGTNSGLLAFLLGQYKTELRPDLKLVPITVLVNSNPFDVHHAKKIIEQVENIFGITFDKHYTTISNSTNKNQVLDIFVKSLYKQNIIQSHFSGLSKNNYLNQTYVETKSVKCHYPMINLTKQDIAECYKNFDIMKSIFDHTSSCKRRTSEQNYHCGQCENCQQRLQNFGQLEPQDNIGLYIDLPRGIARDWSDC